MGYVILTPTNSFVRFDGETTIEHCIHGSFKTCLPVFIDSDIAFQFVIEADTIDEANTLCSPYGSGIEIGIVRDCDQGGFDVQFSDLPERFRLSDLQVLFNWSHGLPGMTAEIEFEECFNIRIIVDGVNYCSNCFQRIPDDCFTSVLEYGNDDDFAGFNYCNSEPITGDEATCEPYVVTFIDVPTLIIPYTASLKDKFGDVPTVQAWIYDGSGNLLNMGIVAYFDAMPPNVISFDFGGPASGIVVIR